MFGTKVKSKNDIRTPKGTDLAATAASSCVFVKGTVIEGKIFTPEDIRLDGVLIGNVISEKRLVMGTEGKIDGNADCNSSSISGKIEGELRVNGTLHLSETASVNGKILAKKLLVDEGASYSGECLIGEQHFRK
ncbi:MAG: polymer-forming cytoskeletal protein [Bacteroidota bacterium]